LFLYSYKRILLVSEQHQKQIHRLCSNDFPIAVLSIIICTDRHAFL
jgi:hypothetical protein